MDAGVLRRASNVAFAVTVPLVVAIAVLWLIDDHVVPRPLWLAFVLGTGVSSMFGMLSRAVERRGLPDEEALQADRIAAALDARDDPTGRPGTRITP